MKAYITKYALSEGVKHVEGEVWGDHGRYFTPAGQRDFAVLVFGRDCFTNRTDAVAKVAEMQAKKIASLTKKIAAIKKLHPEEVVPSEES